MNNIKKLQEKFLNKEIKVVDFVEESYKKIEEGNLNSFITLNKEDALRKAKEIDEKIENKEELGKLFGVTFAIKDNILTEGLRTTSASKMLENFNPGYDAEVVKRIKEEDGIILGKTNMDEFAMGASSETSYFGHVKNPIDNEYVPGGSSSGSAAALGGGEAMFSLGTDTGGSSRQPAAFCGVIGYYPSYGRISRYGVISMANTFDQVGLIGNSVEDIALMMDILSGHDEKDPNSKDLEEDFTLSDFTFEGKKIGVLIEENTAENIREDFIKVEEELRDMGAILEDISLDSHKYIDATYTALMSVEVSSNMARFDGLRYGYHTNEYESFSELYKKSRSEGLGSGVKRRIILGYALSSKNNNQKIYKNALKARKLIRDEVYGLFENYDYIISPTTTQNIWKFNERDNDPMAVYDSGTNNVIANICSIPAISIPYGDGMNKSVQFLAARDEDLSLLNAAREFERRMR